MIEAQAILGRPDEQHHDEGPGRSWPVPVSRRPYDRWRDVEGVHIADGCRVEQIAVGKEHGALPSRLGRHGEVVGRGTSRVTVRFDTETKVAGVRPHLLRVTSTPTPGGDGR